jgi:hypothetical protein
MKYAMIPLFSDPLSILHNVKIVSIEYGSLIEMNETALLVSVVP